MAGGKFVKMLAETVQKSGLDMSEAARMQRAKDMGFDTKTTFYHGNESGQIENDAFDMARAGENFKNSWSDAIYLGDEGLASNYGEVSGKYVVKNPLKINAKEVLYDDYLNAKTGESYEDWLKSVEDSFGLYGFMEQGFPYFKDLAKKQGKDSVVIDFSGLPVKEKRVAFTSDPSAIRKIDAAFDPAQKESSNLMASALPFATVGGVGLASTLSNDAQAAQGNVGSIQAPSKPGYLTLAQKAAAYNRIRQEKLHPILNMALPLGEMPEDLLRKMAYGDDITFKDRLMAALGLM